MYTYQSLRQRVEKQIQAFDLNKEPVELYQPVKYVLNLGGKRIRPVISLMSCDLFKGPVDEAVQPTVGLEIFHNFTLLHDDIMDEANIRRGHPTVHQKWNTNNAILSGDLMQIIANQTLSAVDDDILREVFNLYNDTAIKVCEGQQMDMDFEKRNDVSLDEYLTMIRLKTASLLASSLRLGAVIGRTTDANKEHIYAFGLNLGMAFQVQDDLLDTFGATDQFGKQIGGDIEAGKKTYLLVKALEIANKEQKKRITHLINDAQKNREEKVDEVTALFNDLGIVEETQKERDHYYKEAITSLEAISQNEDRIGPLKELADYLMQRQH